MKKVIIRRFVPGSVFKAVLMAITIPYIVTFGLIFLIAVMGGALNENIRSEFALIAACIPFLLAPIIYGLAFMLFAASYNWLAPKYGGLEIEAEGDSIEEVKAE